MENKVRYQFDRLPMVLFLACLAVTVVAGSVAKRSIMKKNHHPHSHKRMSFPENFFFSFASRYLLLREKNFYVFRFHLVWFFVSLLIIKFFPCFFSSLLSYAHTLRNMWMEIFTTDFRLETRLRSV